MKIDGRQGDTSLTALEDLTAGASVWGLLASGAAKVDSVQWTSEQAVKVTSAMGKTELLHCLQRPTERAPDGAV